MAFVATAIAASATGATLAGTLGVAGAALGVDAGLAGTAMSLSGAGQPQYPNESASSAGMAETNAALLPLQRGMAAAAQTGGQYTFSLPQGASAGSIGIQQTGGGWYDANGNLVSPDQNYTVMRPGTGTGPVGTRGFPTGTIVSPQSMGLTWKPGTQTINGVPVKQNSDGSYTIDFNGFGTAQAEAVNAQQSAASQLALQQQYDPAFIAQALKEEQQADPESFAARNEMNNLVQQQANAPLNEPVSTMLNGQIQDTLNAAQNNSLTGVDQARLNAAVADALGSRGGGSGPANFQTPLTSGFAGEQRQANAVQGAMGFLSSGSDPEDIAYRRTQQNLSNLAAEANGQTPSSQFASLSGASNGPAPMSQGGQLPILADNGAQAQQIGMQNWQTQMNNANNQVSPWLAGTSAMLQLGSALTPRSALPSLLSPSNPAS